MRKNPTRFIFKIVYVALATITLAAIATPPALAASLLPDSNVGALTMIGAVAILMSVLVIEIWRQTGKNTDQKLQRQMIRPNKKRKTL